MSERADIFADDLDLSGFTPKKRTGPPAEEVRKVAENSAFKSREPKEEGEQGRGVPAPKEKASRSIAQPTDARRQRRVFRTGRDAHFSCKARPDVVDEFYAISNAQDWVMGETLEKAVAALKRELARGNR